MDLHGNAQHIEQQTYQPNLFMRLARYQIGATKVANTVHLLGSTNKI